METLDQKLRNVIAQLAGSARMSKLISINATLLAEQLQHGRTSDTAALKVVAGEIQRLSDESSDGIATLHAVLDEVKLLTQTINLAGRQRMLSQKIMKLHLLQRSAHATPARAAELAELIGDFQRSLAALQQSPLNTPAIAAQLARAHQAWERFLSALRSPDIATSSDLNEHLLQEMHAAVQGYEELGGARGATPGAPTGRRPDAASAIAGGTRDTAATKFALFKERGIGIPVTPAGMADPPRRAMNRDARESVMKR